MPQYKPKIPHEQNICIIQSQPRNGQILHEPILPQE